MDNVVPITKHEDYVPFRVDASKYYKIDPTLDEHSRTLYEYILSITKKFHDMAYVEWATTGEATDGLMKTTWGKDLQMYLIKSAFGSLRRNRYLRFQYDTTLGARIMEVMEFVGESIKG
jgi:hypothetical protein